MQLVSDLSFLWSRVACLHDPIFRYRELEKVESDLCEPLLTKGILREAPIPERFLDDKLRCMIVRQVNGRLFGVEDSDEPNGFEVLSEEDVKQYSFDPSAFVATLRTANGIEGRGFSESGGFVRLGNKRFPEVGVARVFLSLGAARFGSMDDKLRLFARESNQTPRIIVFPVYPNLDAETEELLESSNLHITDFSDLDFQINWPLSYGIASPSKPQYALLNEGATWRMIFEGKETTVPDSKGIRYLAQLLANPGKSFTALELAHPEAAQERFVQSDLEATDTHSLREYKRHLQRIEEDLEEARAYGREDDILRLEDEKDAILKHLSGVAATDGKPRLSGEKEKARKSVSAALRRALSSISGQSQDAFLFLNANLSFGSRFSYGSVDCRWEV